MIHTMGKAKMVFREQKSWPYKFKLKGYTYIKLSIRLKYEKELKQNKGK